MGENEREIEKVEIEAEFSACPVCGYNKGFHNMFKKATDNGHLKWYLVCPRCGKRYDIGLTYAAPR